MNNLRLLTWLLCVTMSSAQVCIHAQRVYSLEEIFATAETSSAQLRPAVTSVEETAREVAVARAALLPDINARLSVSYIGDGFTTARDFSDYQRAPIPHLGTGLGVDVTQPVYTGGALTGAIQMAELKSDAARLSQDLSRDNIRLALAGFYLDVYKFYNLRKVVESNTASARKVLEEMRARYTQGVVLQNDITRYELLVSNLELQLVKIDNMIQILNRNLVTVAGLPPQTVVLPDTTILLRSLPCDDEAWWQRQAQEGAPSLGLAAKAVDISRKAETIVRSERLPKIGLQAGWTIDGPILVEIPPISRNLSYWYVGLSVRYNLSSLYKTNKSLARSRVAVRKAEEEYEVADEHLALAVHAEHVKYLEAYEELKTQLKSVELAERNYAVVATRYGEGMALITDMLDAADSRLNAEQQLVNARINIIHSYYKLLFISGKI